MTRVGFIGAGGIVAAHCRKMAKHPASFSVAGFFDVQPERATARAELLGGVAFPSLEAMLASEAVDLCVVATRPHDTHPALAIQALQAGKHVIVEKPFCITVAEADAMIAAARAAGKTLTCHQNRRWDRDFLAIRDLHDKQLCGKPRFIRAESGADVGPCEILYEWGSHRIDQLLTLRGEAPVRVRGHLVFPENPWNQQGAVKALLTFADGFVAELALVPQGTEWGDQQRLPTPVWQLIGETGYVYEFSRDRDEDVWLMSQGFMGMGKDYPYYVPDWMRVECLLPDFYALLAQHFDEGGPCPVLDTEARNTARVIEAIQRSARENREVELEDN